MIIHDAKKGNERVDAFVIDEESVSLGCGGKIMRGDGALENYLAQMRSKEQQIPDAKTGNERVDAFVIDKESVGTVDSLGCGGEILQVDGALENYLP
ncbi:AAA+ ATPase domain-containing protein [Artemisia annua]|uniref:AAA+ ATPase domain-containing protein n=1 Tax=Artemisia annua TaxID=35608 RepID=A0A2U1LIL1_ARTAN|nr:AAA+ ATPase domain-containing protein [Artemisia annua]